MKWKLLSAKTITKIFFSGTKQPMTLKVGMQHRPGTRVLPSLFKWWPRVDIDLFYILFNGFFRTIVVYDIKVGRFSQLNEYMNLYEYQRSWSFIDLRPSSLRFNIFKLLLLRNREPIEAKFHKVYPWDVGNEKLFKCSRSHDHAHIWWKN